MSIRPDNYNQERRSVLAWVQIARLTQKMEQRLNNELGKYGLTLSQFEVLYFLNASEGMTQRELAAQLLVTKGNVCGLLNRLTENKFVVRREHPEDKRSNTLYLTAAGKSVFEQTLPLHDQSVKTVMTALSEKEQSLLSNLLTRIDDLL